MKKLTDADQQMLIQIEDAGKYLQDLIKKVHDHLKAQHDSIANDSVPGEFETERHSFDLANPGMWYLTSEVQFKNALMSLERSITQPTKF